MAPARETEVWRNRDDRAWRIGRGAEIAWIQQNTAGGRAITAAIPPMFEAYATLELPGTGDHDQASWFEDPDRHDADSRHHGRGRAPSHTRQLRQSHRHGIPARPPATRTCLSRMR